MYDFIECLTFVKLYTSKHRCAYSRVANSDWRVQLILFSVLVLDVKLVYRL